MSGFFGKPKIGLALSGGAARGLAHIGVIKSLEEERIPVSFVAGTSVGSLIGALFASGMSWREMADTARSVKWKDLISLSFRGLGIARTTKLKEIIDDLLEGKSFDELSIPFTAVATDIITGEKVLLRDGSVAAAVLASSSIPGIFEPTTIGGRQLVDGGLKDNLPCNVVREMGARIVIAVDLNSDHIISEPPKTAIDVLFRSFQILMQSAREHGGKTEIVIAPDLTGKNYHNLKPVDEYISLGEEASRRMIGEIKKKAGLG